MTTAAVHRETRPYYLVTVNSPKSRLSFSPLVLRILPAVRVRRAQEEKRYSKIIVLEKFNSCFHARVRRDMLCSATQYETSFRFSSERSSICCTILDPSPNNLEFCDPPCRWDASKQTLPFLESSQTSHFTDRLPRSSSGCTLTLHLVASE